MKNILQPVKRAAASDVFTLSPAVAGSRVFLNSLLGLAPQALCCRPLRGLRELLLLLRGLGATALRSSSRVRRDA